MEDIVKEIVKVVNKKPTSIFKGTSEYEAFGKMKENKADEYEWNLYDLGIKITIKPLKK
jgi:hypothetical protein